MTEYIHVTNWDKFQRFNDRRPRWGRLHFDLHRNDDYMGLTPNRRCMLIGIWIEYGQNVRADAEGRFSQLRGLRQDTASLSRRLAQRVLSKDLEALNHAGFIWFSEHETVTTGDGFVPLEVETETEVETEKNQDQEPNPTPPVASDHPPQLQPKKNGLGVEDGINNGKDLEPVGETAAQLIAKLRGAA